MRPGVADAAGSLGMSWTCLYCLSKRSGCPNVPYNVDVEANFNSITETNSQDIMENIIVDKQPLENNFLKTNIYEDAPLKLSFDETLVDMEKNVVDSLSFMKQAVSTCVNPAE
ncbi:hypothetical protein A2U01_0038973, partial [Trifolium medium]|nr:hypothetical protein [Trifolium medium]